MTPSSVAITIAPSAASMLTPEAGSTRSGSFTSNEPSVLASTHW